MGAAGFDLCITSEDPEACEGPPSSLTRANNQVSGIERGF